MILKKTDVSTARWTIFTVLILTYILVYFHRMAPGVVSEYLMADFKTTGTRLGSLSAIYFFVYAAMQLPSGVLADTLGTRTSVIAGNLTAGVGSILFGMAPSFEVACAGRFLVGLGVSVVFVSIMKSNSVWFHARVFGLMSGVTLFIGNLGSVTAAGPLSFLLGFLDWRTVFMGIGCFSLVLALFGWLIVVNRPEDLGFDPPNPADPEETEISHSWFSSLFTVLKTARIWPGFWVQLGAVGSLYAFMGLWGVPYLRDVHGLARPEAARYMTVMLLCFALGALFFGWFSDRMKNRKSTMAAGMGLHAMAWLILVFTPWSPGVSGFILFGAVGFFGASFVITFASAKEIIRPDLSGMAVSVVNSGCFIGTALVQPLFGWIADLTWDGTVISGVRIYSQTDYQHAFWLMIGFVLIGFAASFFITETRCRNLASHS